MPRAEWPRRWEFCPSCSHPRQDAQPANGQPIRIWRRGLFSTPTATPPLSWGSCLGVVLLSPSLPIYDDSRPGPRTDSQAEGSCAVLQALGQCRACLGPGRFPDPWEQWNPSPQPSGPALPPAQPHMPPTTVSLHGSLLTGQRPDMCP